MAIDKVGQQLTKGFYVPASQSSSYVASQRNEEGTYKYTGEAQELAKERQSALQALGEQYGEVVNNAYASYLNNQRTINASAMGQGYKDTYNQMQQQARQEGINQAGLSAANARQQINAQTVEAREQLDEQFALETANLDKVGTSLNNYFEYLKNLTNAAEQNYLQANEIAYDDATTAQDIYAQLYEAKPYLLNESGNPLYTDENAEKGMSFADYVNANLGTKQADTDWRDWLFYQGGWQQYIDALNKSNKPEAALAQKNAALEERREEIGVETKPTQAVNLKTGKVAGLDLTIDGKNYYYSETPLDYSKAKEVYDYYSDLGHLLQPGEIVTIDGKEYIYSDVAGRDNKGFYEIKGERGNDYVTRGTKEKRGWFDTIAYNTDGKTYEAKQVVQARSAMSQQLIDDLKIKKRLDSGELHVGDVIKYEYGSKDRFGYKSKLKTPAYYIIDSVGDGISFVKIDYKE